MILIPQGYWEIKDTPDKGRGLFSKKTISKGIIIGDYLGKIIHPQDAVVDENNFYLMYYHDLAVITPDLEKPGIHLLNHSCLPNTFVYIYKGHTLVFALRDISKGEELTTPYLLPPQDKYCDPCVHICRCGSPACSGIMHLSKEKYDKWKKLNEMQAGETKKERISYGKDLPPLLSYPRNIPEAYIRKVTRLFLGSSGS